MPEHKRHLGLVAGDRLQHDPYDFLGVAFLALANLRVGERVPLDRRPWVVKRIGKTLTLQDGDDTWRLSPGSRRWEQFLRDVDGLISGSYHGIDAGDLLTALARDPKHRPLI